MPGRQPAGALQVSGPLQKLPSSQLRGVPGLQAPPWQVSAPLQALPSEQPVPSARGVWLHTPVIVLQLSVVQAFPSLQFASVVHVGSPTAKAPRFVVKPFPRVLFVATTTVSGAVQAAEKNFLMMKLNGCAPASISEFTKLRVASYVPGTKPPPAVSVQ